MKRRIYTTKRITLEKARKRELREERGDKLMFLFIITVLTLLCTGILLLVSERQSVVDCTKWQRWAEDYTEFQPSQAMILQCEEYEIYLYD